MFFAKKKSLGESKIRIRDIEYGEYGDTGLLWHITKYKKVYVKGKLFNRMIQWLKSLFKK